MENPYPKDVAPLQKVTLYYAGLSNRPKRSKGESNRPYPDNDASKSNRPKQQSARCKSGDPRQKARRTPPISIPRSTATDTRPSDPIDTQREACRAVYSKISRGRPHAIFQLYDFPDVTQRSQRQVTTTPLQQLLVLNSEWFEYQAKSLAQRVHHICDSREKIQALYRRTLQRNRTPRELDQAQAYRDTRDTHIIEYTQAPLVTNEFIYLR